MFLIGSVQFIQALDFNMVIPLGPDFAKALGIPSSNLGFVGGSYTAAAALASIAGAFFLDRFDRRRALVCVLAGLVVGTAAGGLATDLPTLLAARAITGTFGGPTLALALALVTDTVPPERRGRALAAVMSSYSVATVLGVPAGLELAQLGGWRAPFFTVAALELAVAVAVAVMLPPQRAHRAAEHHDAPMSFRDVLRRPVVQLALAGTAVNVIGGFVLIPNIPTYFQFNRGYPRDDLALLYAVPGVISFGTLRIAGRLSDRHGAPPVMIGGAVAYAAVLLLGFIYPVEAIPVLAIFIGFTAVGGFRHVPMNSLSSRIPGSRERARFMSAQVAVQYLGLTAGSMLGAKLLTEHADGSLAGIDDVAWFGIAMALAHTAIGYAIDRRVSRAPPLPTPAQDRK